MQSDHKPYVLVTAARDEVDFIALTIESVVAQTVLPLKWVIVSDGSVDGTDDVVLNYAARYEFIHFIRNDATSERNIGAKVRSINTGIAALGHTEFAYLGNLDADVSFGEDYFKTLLQRFGNDSDLGVIGGRIYQPNARGDAVEAKASTESVAGAIQFFRRECFDQIGGYQPLARGMEDGIAEITARYYGWKTRSYRDLPVVHHRELGTVGRSIYRTRFSNGLTAYLVGYGFTYQVMRALSRVSERPYVIGAALVIAGYMWGLTSRQPRLISQSIIGFIRREQRARLLGRIGGERR